MKLSAPLAVGGDVLNSRLISPDSSRGAYRADQVEVYFNADGTRVAYTRDQDTDGVVKLHAVNGLDTELPEQIFASGVEAIGAAYPSRLGGCRGAPPRSAGGASRAPGAIRSSGPGKSPQTG